MPLVHSFATTIFPEAMVQLRALTKQCQTLDSVAQYCHRRCHNGPTGEDLVRGMTQQSSFFTIPGLKYTAWSQQSGALCTIDMAVIQQYLAEKDVVLEALAKLIKCAVTRIITPFPITARFAIKEPGICLIQAEIPQSQNRGFRLACAGLKVVDGKAVSVVQSQCDEECTIRASGRCKHVAALMMLLFFFEHSSSKTSLPADWIRPMAKPDAVIGGAIAPPVVVYLSECRLVGFDFTFADIIKKDFVVTQSAKIAAIARQQEQRIIDLRRKYTSSLDTSNAAMLRIKARVDADRGLLSILIPLQVRLPIADVILAAPLYDAVLMDDSDDMDAIAFV